MQNSTDTLSIWSKIYLFVKKNFILIPLAFYGILWAYDLLVGNNDGVLSGWYFNRFFLRFFVFLAFCYFCIFLSRRQKGFAKTLGYNGLFFLGFISFLEFVSWGYTVFSKEEINKPSFILFYDNPKFTDMPTFEMWADINDSVGHWRHPNAQVFHPPHGKPLITYTTNSLGLRDKERNKESKGRVAFLGDSFIEGLLHVNAEERLSDLLEDSTKIEHVNFGIGGANPTDYYMIYKHLAKPNYDHEKVIVCFYTGNDFEHYGHVLNGDLLKLPHYRPYWKATNRDTSIVYTLANKSSSYSTFPTPSYHKFRQTRDSLYNMQSIPRKLFLMVQTESYLWSVIAFVGKKIAYKNYHNNYVGIYEKPDWNTPRVLHFEKSIEALLKEIGNKPVLFVIIPDEKDVKNFIKNNVNNFTPYLSRKYTNANVIDLMPAFAEKKQDLERYFVQGDGHWNAAGNKLAAEYVLGHPDYIEFIKK